MHQHSHEHSHAPANYDRAFALGIVLNVVYIAVEAVFGVLANSLALLADAGHNLSDVLGLVLAWGAHYLSRLQPSGRRTYGWRSSSILAALANALILLVALGGIVWEAIRRFAAPPEIMGETLIWVASVGVIINAATAMLFFKGRQRDLNIKGAYLHMAADAGVSLGVVIAGAAIAATGLRWIDPATSLFVAAVIFVGTWSLLRESLDLVMHAAPHEIDVDEVRAYLESLPGVDHVHDLHIWAMSTTETALTAHLVKPEVENDDRLLAEAAHHLHDRFNIEHTTLQMERNADSTQCRQAPPSAV